MTTDPPRETSSPNLCCDDVWRALTKASFAVISHVAPDDEPRSSGVVYAVLDRRLFVAVDAGGWKGRQIADGSTVSLTVPVRRGGLLSLLLPIPPATISFRATAHPRPAGALGGEPLPPALGRLVPDDRREHALLVELEPQGRFVTYGIGVSLQRMRDPEASGALVPVA
jgi:hypothetical protein